MVAQVFWLVAPTIVAWLGQASSSQFMRLPPAARFRILGALFLLAIFGVAFVTLTWMALRIGRRNLRRLEDQAPQWSKVRADDWASKPLAAKPSAHPDTHGH